jgi:hypothetical protein
MFHNSQILKLIKKMLLNNLKHFLNLPHFMHGEHTKIKLQKIISKKVIFILKLNPNLEPLKRIFPLISTLIKLIK